MLFFFFFVSCFVFFFNDTATTEIYTLSLHDALPIWGAGSASFFLTLGGGTYQRRMDDLLLSHDTAIDPDLFFQHVTRNVAWTSEYFAKDILLKPASGGRIMFDDAPDPSGGTWHKIADPPTGWKVSKTTWATADDFDAGLEVTFSEVPAGAKAVRVVAYQEATRSYLYYRKSGDSNISNTPSASTEVSHFLMGAEDRTVASVIWLNSDYKAQFTVTDVLTDLRITYPIEYLI